MMTQPLMEMNLERLTQAATQARGLAMDAVTACKSGHLGLPLGAAEVGAVLFGHSLSYNPEDPHWLNRDRFILSAGHGSMFLYAWLHLSGHDLSLEEVRNFRQLNSKTPGHPEFSETPGVECTTGPLGQGVGNATGMAVAAKMAAARFNTPEHTLFDHHIIALCGDGCLQEGVAAEAASFAGHFGLDNLIIIYDSNDVTLDAMADKTQSEDTAKRFEAYGFDVVTIDGHNMTEIDSAVRAAKENDNGKPKFIIAKTEIGRGIPEVAGTNKAHGEAGVKFVDEARKALGLPEEKFYVSEEVQTYFSEHKAALVEKYNAWEETFKAWKEANPQLAALLQQGLSRELPGGLLEDIPKFEPKNKIATREAGSQVLQPLAQAMPLLVSGSADLHGSTKNLIKEASDFSSTDPMGRNIFFGIREHAMGAIVNGFGYYGLFWASGATFLTFSDYMRPSVRLAALSHLPVSFIWTHDSVGVGEDGPTHQPVETTASLRLIPNLDVIRPADAEETAGAFYAAMERKDGPTALILTRQGVPSQDTILPQDRREGVLKGGYVAKKETGSLDLIIIATGSELQHAMVAADQLGGCVRVVSMPCCERFDAQTDSYRESVLPKACRKRIAIEAGATAAWYKYVGLDGKVLGIDRFGISAPGDLVMKELGMTAEAVEYAAKTM
tara:strand:+ start:2442 stop:4445 length:2004 start_codon:yes stop_codon:yes gene_type:complete